MKKRFTVIAGFLCATGVSFSQVAINAPQRQMTSATVGVEKVDGKLQKPNHNSVKAEGDIIFQSNFSSATGWNIGTSGQGTFEVGTMNNTQLTGYVSQSGMQSSTAANGYAFFNGIQYIITGGPGAQPQNTWIATDPFNYSAIPTIDVSFEQLYRAFNFSKTFVEYSADGTTWTSIQVNSTLDGNATTNEDLTVTFQTGGSSQGVVRFRWESIPVGTALGSGYAWLVDDVVISEGYANNVQMIHTYTSIGAEELSYTKMPVAQASGAGSVSFGAEIKNVGTVSNDFGLKVTSGSYDYTGSYVPVAPFASDSISILTANGMAIPTTVGVSNFTFTTVADGVTLDQVFDDSKVVNFEVTNYVYAVDGYNGTAASMTGSFTGWLNGLNDPAIGTLYEVFNTADLYSIQVGIAPVGTANQGTFVNNQFFAKIFKYNGTTFEYVDESDAHVLVAADFGTLVPFVLNSPITLDAGLYLVVASSYSGSPIPVGMAGTSIAGSTMGMDGDDFIRLASNDATPNIVRSPVVRLGFDPSVSVDKVAKDENNVTVFPNPFDAHTEVKFTVSSSASVAVNVTDVMGREVISVPAANYASGTHSISLDGVNLEAGLYNYTITIGNNVVAKRIIKK